MLKFALALTLPALVAGTNCDTAECCVSVKCDDASITCTSPTVKIAAASTTDAGPIAGRATKCCTQPCSAWTGTCPTTHTTMAGSTPGASTAECCAPIMCTGYTCSAANTGLKANPDKIVRGEIATAASTCCAPTCSGVTCPTATHTSKGGTTLGSTPAQCCTPIMCNAATCSSGIKVLKLNADQIPRGTGTNQEAQCCTDQCADAITCDKGKVITSVAIAGAPDKTKCCVNAAVPASDLCTGNTDAQPVGWTVNAINTTRDFKCPVDTHVRSTRVTTCVATPQKISAAAAATPLGLLVAAGVVALFV